MRDRLAKWIGIKMPSKVFDDPYLLTYERNDKMTIYDWENKPTEIQIDEPIEHIHVTILSGDEIVTVNCKYVYDAGQMREMAWYDGEYDVEGGDIEKWLNWKPSKRDPDSYAYQRQNAIWKLKHKTRVAK